MKTVGIITTYKQSNWGSVLQAYALQFIIRDFGFKVWLIDYKYPNDYHWTCGYQYKAALTSPKNIKRRIAELFHIRDKSKMEKLNDFILRNCLQTITYENSDELKKNPPLFDIYVTGSDQVWNPNTMYGDMAYFLDFAPKGNKKVAYASSFSCDTIPQCYQEAYKKWLAQYNNISVREFNGLDLVKNLIGKEVPVVLDPTLLLEKQRWHEIAKGSIIKKVPTKYILVYMLGYTYSPEQKMTELLCFLQNKYSVPVIALGRLPSRYCGSQCVLPKYKTVGIPEFLYFIENAFMVVTSSFHGTAFSINFGVPFVALYDGRSKGDDRISSLVKEMGLKKNAITTETEISDSTVQPFYDVEEEQSVLNRLRHESISFLKNSLFS